MTLRNLALGALIASAAVIGSAVPATAATPAVVAAAACSKPVQTFPPAGFNQVSYAGTLHCSGPATYDRMLTITLIERRAPYRDVRYARSCHFTGAGQCTAQITVSRKVGASYLTGVPTVTTTILPPL